MCIYIDVFKIYITDYLTKCQRPEPAWTGGIAKMRFDCKFCHQRRPGRRCSEASLTERPLTVPQMLCWFGPLATNHSGLHQPVPRCPKCPKSRTGRDSPTWSTYPKFYTFSRSSCRSGVRERLTSPSCDFWDTLPPEAQNQPENHASSRQECSFVSK